MALQDHCSYKAPTTNHHINKKNCSWAVEEAEALSILSITRTAKVGPLEKDKGLYVSAAQGCHSIRLFRET